MERREESKAVKAALARAGIKARVSHGRGTAWSWLKITLPASSWRARQLEAVRIAQAVTGRHGEYDGRINVY